MDNKTPPSVDAEQAAKLHANKFFRENVMSTKKQIEYDFFMGWQQGKEAGPEYLKIISTGAIVKVSDLVSGVYKNHLHNYLPATEQEFLNQGKEATPGDEKKMRTAIETLLTAIEFAATEHGAVYCIATPDIEMLKDAIAASTDSKEAAYIKELEKKLVDLHEAFVEQSDLAQKFMKIDFERSDSKEAIEVEKFKRYMKAGMSLIEELRRSHNGVLKNVDISNEDKRVLLNQNGISSEFYEHH